MWMFGSDYAFYNLSSNQEVRGSYNLVNRECPGKTIPTRTDARIHTACTATDQGQMFNCTFHLCSRRQLETVPKIVTQEEVGKLVARPYSYLLRELKDAGGRKQPGEPFASTG